MFEKIMGDINKMEEPEVVKPKIADGPALNPEAFRDRINSISTMPERELYNIIKESYKSILSDIMKRQDKEYLDVFTTPKFISILTQVLNFVQLTKEETLCCNKLVYDYITLKNNDTYVKESLFVLSKMVNRQAIQGLISVGLPENLATYLALARWSDTKESVNIKRLNFIIATSSPKIMTVQTIVFAYEKLFDAISDLVETTMFDIYDDDEPWVTEDIMEVYGNISLAVLTILNNMPMHLIKKILKCYTEDFGFLHGGNPKCVRFSMKCISDDFIRILNTVEQLEYEGTFVP